MIHFSPLRTFRILCLGLAFFLTLDALPASASVYQYSAPVGTDPYRKAYLWIPEKCQHVRGVIIGIQNMLEQMIFEDPVIRQTAAECDLAIMWITPADDAGDKSTPFHKFTPPDQIKQSVEDLLAQLAETSGYAELKGAPMIAIAHSAATPFVWGMANAFGAARMIAILPTKGWFMGLPPNIPTLHIAAEYAEVGGANWGETMVKDRTAVMKIRSGGEDRLIGEFCDVGAGHFEWDPEMAPVMGMFIRKAVEARVPRTFTPGQPVTLKPVAPQSGWLLDPAKIGNAEAQPVPYHQWKGDPKTGLWYFDREMAQTVNDFMATRLAKKPQVIDFTDAKGQPLPLTNGGNPSLPVQFLPDGYTFKVAAKALDQSPIANLYGGAAAGHAPGPIQFKASSGAIQQTGPDTFRIWMKRGGLVQQSSPWEPWIMAWQPGDQQYRRADRPGHPWLYTVNKTGQAQAIDFPKIADQRYGTLTLKLHATSDAGLPVQFYMVSGPADLDEKDNTLLVFQPAPPRTKFPVKVIVGAYQWGRALDPKVQSATPVFQEFELTK